MIILVRMSTTKKRTSLPQLANTFDGIEHWFEHTFEHLGWMVLAAGKGQHKKVELYKESIERLLETIHHVSQEYRDHDRLHDLNVLRINTEYLLDFVNSNL